MHWIYLSPHLDDAILSCGGLIWQQVQAGEVVEVWNLCAGDPPDGPLTPFAGQLHQRWQTGPQAVCIRRSEDRAACAVLGAAPRYFDLPDCIYRRLPDGAPLVHSETDIFCPPLAAEQPVIAGLAGQLAEALPAGAQLVCPLTLGGHRDHRLGRAAAETLRRPLAYYADYPYAVQAGVEVGALLPAAARAEAYPVSTAALAAWQRSVAAYRSQISTFWNGEQAMCAALEDYWRKGGGAQLWFT